jgi:signal transduction histidine kinase
MAMHDLRTADEPHLAGLAEEQAALRRVATVVARGADPAAIFACATEEIGRLFDSDSAGMLRYEAEAGTAEMVGRWESGDRRVFDVGTLVSLEHDTTISRVYRAGRPVRLHWTAADGPLAEGMRAAGFTTTVASPVVVDGRLWGAVSVGWAHREVELPDDVETKLGAFCELVALGLSSAEARASLLDSRARIVEAGDAARLRLARDLHDGAQQRLVAVGLLLRAAARSLQSAPAQTAELLATASGALDEANAELRELARGIHPVALTEQGLAAAVHGLARRSTLPISVESVPDGRLPASIEVAAYYVVSEALTNVAKHAGASRVTVSCELRDDGLAATIADDGCGGADPGGGGLRGLADRVEALRGSIRVDSPAGGGTTVVALLPFAEA